MFMLNRETIIGLIAAAFVVGVMLGSVAYVRYFSSAGE
jgi:uncharacterized membrane protein